MMENKLIECYKRAMEIRKEEFEEDSEAIDLYKITIELIEEVQQYRAIGTVEDCQEARERQKPKKLTHEGTLLMSCTCPNCKNVLDEFETWGESRIRVKHNYCHFCGQKLNWSE